MNYSGLMSLRRLSIEEEKVQRSSSAAMGCVPRAQGCYDTQGLTGRCQVLRYSLRDASMLMICLAVEVVTVSHHSQIAQCTETCTLGE